MPENVKPPAMRVDIYLRLRVAHDGKGRGGQAERYLGKSDYALSVAVRYFKPQNFLSDNE